MPTAAPDTNAVLPVPVTAVVPAAGAAWRDRDRPCLQRRFIKWTQETFSAGGHKAELLPLLERCTRELQAGGRYAADIRYLRVWVQYVSRGLLSHRGWAAGEGSRRQPGVGPVGAAAAALTALSPPPPPQADCLPDPGDVFSFLRENEIGQDRALFYVAYATYLEVGAGWGGGGGRHAGGGAARRWRGLCSPPGRAGHALRASARGEGALPCARGAGALPCWGPCVCALGHRRHPCPALQPRPRPQARGGYAKADAVYQQGINRLAAPVERLRAKYAEFQQRMVGARWQRERAAAGPALQRGLPCWWPPPSWPRVRLPALSHPLPVPPLQARRIQRKAAEQAVGEEGEPDHPERKSLGVLGGRRPGAGSGAGRAGGLLGGAAGFKRKAAAAGPAPDQENGGGSGLAIFVDDEFSGEAPGPAASAPAAFLPAGRCGHALRLTWGACRATQDARALLPAAPLPAVGHCLLLPILLPPAHPLPGRRPRPGPSWAASRRAARRTCSGRVCGQGRR